MTKQELNENLKNKDFIPTLEDIDEEAKKDTKILYKVVNRNPRLTYCFEDVLRNQDIYATRINEIKDYLRNNKHLDIEELHYLNRDYCGSFIQEELDEIMNLILVIKDDEDRDLQLKYEYYIKRILENIADNTYLSRKENFDYPDVVNLEIELNELYKNYSVDARKEIVNKIYTFTGETLDYDEINNKVIKLYEIWSKRRYLPREETTEFFNKILNRHRDYFLKTQRKELNNVLMRRLNISKKVFESEMNKRKIRKIKRIISKKQYYKLIETNKKNKEEKTEENKTLTKEEKIEKNQEALESLTNNIATLIKDLLSNKNINKFLKNNNINKQEFKEKLQKIGIIFLDKGIIEKDQVKEILNIEEKDIINYIYKKFNFIKYTYKDNIELNESEINEIKKNYKPEGLDYKHYKFFDNEKYYENIAKLLVRILPNQTQDILKNKELIKKIIYLLPIVSVFREVDDINYFDLIMNIEEVDKKFDLNNKININSNLTQITKYAKSRKEINRIISMLFEKNTIDKLEENYYEDYIKTFIKMYSRTNTNIPPVRFNYNSLSIESGRFSDSARLVIGKIGKKNDQSCIRLNGKGEGGKTYNTILLDENADTAIIRDKQGNLKNRILIFRKGNVVQLCTSGNEKIDISIFNILARRIMEKAKQNNDNIDFILLNNKKLVEKYKDKVIIDSRLKDEFPHADIDKYAIVLIKNKPTSEINLEEKPKFKYLKARKKTSHNTTLNNINSIYTINNIIENNEIKEIELDMNDIYGLIAGEDWFLVIHNDYKIDEFKIKTNDYRQELEIDKAKKLLVDKIIANSFARKQEEKPKIYEKKSE